MRFALVTTARNVITFWIMKSTATGIGIVAALVISLFVNVACGGGDSSALHGSWFYVSGESQGSTTSVSGDLTFTAAGRFEDNRYIGGTGGFRKGTYSVSGDKLTLTADDKGTQTFSFSFGTTDRPGGKKIRTLLLRGSGLSFLLGKKEA